MDTEKGLKSQINDNINSGRREKLNEALPLSVQVKCAVGDIVIDFGIKHVEQLFALSLFEKRKAKHGHMPPQKAAVY